MQPLAVSRGHCWLVKWVLEWGSLRSVFDDGRLITAGCDGRLATVICTKGKVSSPTLPALTNADWDDISLRDMDGIYIPTPSQAPNLRPFSVMRVEQVVATDSETLMPFLRVEAPPLGLGLDALEDTFATDETIDQVDCITKLDGERLYRMQWTRRINLLVQILVEEDGTILSASGTGDGWHLRLLFPSRESLARTHEYCYLNGLECEIRSVYDIDEVRQGRSVSRTLSRTR